MGSAAQALCLALALSVLLCPVAHGTGCHETPCGVCRKGGSLAFQSTTLQVRQSPRVAMRRRGVLSMKAGLRDWLGFGRKKREQWKQAVTETNGPGLTDEEKLEAARMRRRALVVQDPVYLAKLAQRGTMPVKDVPTPGYSRDTSTRAAPPPAQWRRPQVPPVPQNQPSREDTEEAEARRLRQLELQRDAARTLGKNSASFSGGKTRTKSVGNPAGTVRANSVGDPAATPISVGRRPDQFGLTQERSLSDELPPVAGAPRSMAAPEAGLSSGSVRSTFEVRSDGEAGDENNFSSDALGVSDEAPRVPPAMPRNPVGQGEASRVPVVNYKEAWREAANRNLFTILNRSRQTSTVSRSASSPESNAGGAKDDTKAVPALGATNGAPVPPAASMLSQTHSATSSEAATESQSVEVEEELEDDQLEALPILGQDSAASVSTGGSQYVRVASLPADGVAMAGRQDMVQNVEELPELEVVGGEVVGTKKVEQKVTRDLWKVIAPKGLVVRAGPSDDSSPIARLSEMQVVEIVAEQGVWLKLAQSVGNEEGWVRKEEGRGKRGGGLARKNPALMVKQGRALGFDSKEMSKWKAPTQGSP